MDNEGQLTFSDDPLLNATNNVFQLIENGEFGRAVEILDNLLNVNPDYPGLADCYRIAKFWMNRESEIRSRREGKDTADYLMSEWDLFREYAEDKGIDASSAFKSVMRYIFFTASEHYKTAFKKQQDSIDNFDLLLNLGDCFLRLEEYNHTIDTLEYARSSYNSNARLLAILGEAYYHIKEYPKSLLYFREAFFVNASEIDMDLLKARPIIDLVEIIKNERNEYNDIREWVPVYGFLKDIFYARRNLSKHQVEKLKADIYSLEQSYQKMDSEQRGNSNILPRLLNRYLWMLDYYEFQNFNSDNIADIKKRLTEIDPSLFDGYFKD
jgi:tetratricopeptide (TPR) repeat protein